MAEDKKKMGVGVEEAMPTKNLPKDVIVDILSRLPMKSLPKYRCVCKTWCALITDPAFVKMNLSRSLATNTNLNLIFIDFCHLYSVALEDAWEQQAVIQVDPPLKSPLPGTNVLLGFCDGLICLRNSDEGIYLWNPSTRRHQKLPDTPTKIPPYISIAYGFGYDLNTDDYKLVRVVQCNSENNKSWDSDVKVYSHSTNSWRRIGLMPFHLMLRRRNEILTNSAIHWIAKRKMVFTEPKNDNNGIVSFDLKDEQYREVPLPDFVDDTLSMVMGVLGGQLMLSIFFRVNIEVWVMEDYGVKDSWVKKFSIDQSVIGFDYIEPICLSKNGLVLVKREQQDVFPWRKG